MRKRRGRGGDDDSGDDENGFFFGGDGSRRQARRTGGRDAAAASGAIKPGSSAFSCCLRSRRVDVPGVPGGRREAAAGAVEACEGGREKTCKKMNWKKKCPPTKTSLFYFLFPFHRGRVFCLPLSRINITMQASMLSSSRCSASAAQRRAAAAPGGVAARAICRSDVATAIIDPSSPSMSPLQRRLQSSRRASRRSSPAPATAMVSRMR